MEETQKLQDNEDLIREYLMPSKEDGKYPFKILNERPEGMSVDLYQTIKAMQYKRIKAYKKGTVVHESRYQVEKVDMKGNKTSKTVSSTYRKEK